MTDETRGEQAFMLDAEETQRTAQAVADALHNKGDPLDEIGMLLDQYYTTAEALATARAATLSELDKISKDGITALASLERQIADLVKRVGQSVRGWEHGVLCVYTPPGISESVDIDRLKGYAIEHPEALRLITTKPRAAKTAIRMPTGTPFKDLLP